MTGQDTKILVLDALLDRDVWMKQTMSDPTEYRTRCPFCGDSNHSTQTGHLYIKIDTTNNAAMVYYCFRCDEYGIVTREVLEELGIHDTTLLSSVDTFNKTADKNTATRQVQRVEMYDFVLPNDTTDRIRYGRQLSYVEDRLDIMLDDADIRSLKIIPSIYAFLEENKIDECLWNKESMDQLDREYVGFLSYGNSHILLRSLNPREKKYRWIKYPLTKETMKNRVFYSIASNLDIFTQDTIHVYLTEGILDIISARYNINTEVDNAIFISVCGKGYHTILKYLLSIGILGNNVCVDIFADNDAVFNQKAKVATDLEFFQKTLRNQKHFYKNVTVYYNQKDKDIGVPKNRIFLEKHRI